jgi:hypothetical protein
MTLGITVPTVPAAYIAARRGRRRPERRGIDAGAQEGQVREPPAHPWRVELRMARAVETVPGEADTERTPDEPM